MGGSTIFVVTPQRRYLVPRRCALLIAVVGRACSAGDLIDNRQRHPETQHTGRTSESRTGKANSDSVDAERLHLYDDRAVRDLVFVAWCM